MNIDILLVALVTSLATSLIGVFLVLRRLSMMTDAIAHTVLLGIVLMYMVVRDLNSPWLLVGATLSGVLTVWLIELMRRIRLVKEDAAIGMVMTFLFSVAIILISTRLRNVHLHIDTVLLGQLEFVMFERTLIFGRSLPTSLVIMSVVLMLNALFVGLFYKEYKLLSFDRTLSFLLGFSPWLLHYLFMTLISLTAVAAFNAVGAIMVIALMVGPVMTARLLTDRLPILIALTLSVAVMNTLMGYVIAFRFDLNTAASMATMTLGHFLVMFVMSPKHGFMFNMWRTQQQKQRLHILTLITHLAHHQETDEAALECDPKTLHHHFNWSMLKMKWVLTRAQKYGYIQEKNAMMLVTAKGHRFFNDATRMKEATRHEPC